MTRHATLPGRPARNGIPAAVAWTYRSATAVEDAARELQVQYEVRMIQQQAAAEVFGWFPDDDSYEWRREAQLAAAEEPPALIDEPQPEPESEPPSDGRCDVCGYLLIRCSCPGGPR